MERTRGGERLQVNSAALVDLKAALFRKQQEYKKEKSSPVTTSTVAAAQEASERAGRKVSDKTASVWLNASKKVKKKESGQTVNGRNSRGDQRDARDSSHQLSQYEEEQLAKSRRALEAKAAIYDRLSCGGGLKDEEDEGEEDEGDGEEGDPRYMVDFTRKIWEEHMNSQSTSLSSASSMKEDPSKLSKKPNSPSALTTTDQSEERDPTPPPQSADEEWVEYVDSFGRTRSCLMKDLPEFTRIDQQLEAKKQERKRERNRSPTPDLLSEDMRRERERKQWEQDAEEELEQDEPVGPVHYQELRGGEVRTHGVGYYAFSVDEEQRREQLGLLNKLREQTLTQREKREKLQEKRKALLEARLAKVRERKLKQKPEEAKQAGQAGSNTTAIEGIADFNFKKGQTGSVEKIKSDRDDELSSLLAQAKEQAELEQDRKEEEKRRAHVRPWDRGKVVDPIKKRKQELRDERLNEFAPPAIYSKSSTSEQPSPSKRPRTDPEMSSETAPTNITTLTGSHGAPGTTQDASSAPAVTGVPASQLLHQATGYFHPPTGFYPPPPPPPAAAMFFTPMRMTFVLPPPGTNVYVPPPPMAVRMPYYPQTATPTDQSYTPLRPPPPPPGLPSDLSK